MPPQKNIAEKAILQASAGAPSAAAAYQEISAALREADWRSLVDAVADAGDWLRVAPPGSDEIDALVAQLVGLAAHQKWEVRYTVAVVATTDPRPAFHSLLLAMTKDESARVSAIAERALARRRAWGSVGSLSRQHQDRIRQSLDDIEEDFGIPESEAVCKASELIAAAYVRELSHELASVMGNLSASVERLRARLPKSDPQKLEREMERIARSATHMHEALADMRAFMASPELEFANERLRALIEDAAALLSQRSPAPAIVIDVDADLSAQVCRMRFVQAIANLLNNAVEAYEDGSELTPIAVRAFAANGTVTITVQDTGKGMTAEAQRDAALLFSTSKPNGAGIGLPLAIKIVESEHRGRLTLKSTVGVGTQAQVLIPQLHTAIQPVPVPARRTNRKTTAPKTNNRARLR